METKGKVSVGKWKYLGCSCCTLLEIYAYKKNKGGLKQHTKMCCEICSL